MDLITHIRNIPVDLFKAEDILFYAHIEVERHFTKKNSRPIFKRGGKPFIGKNPTYAKAEDAMVLKLRSQGNQQRIFEPIECDLWAMFIFHFDNYYLQDRSRRSQKLGDLSNLYQMPEDCLQRAGIIKNDGQICSHDLSRRLPSNKTYLEIFLLKF